MTDTWGIPGPVFAGLYLGLLLIPLAAAGLRVSLLRAGKDAGEPLTRIGQVAMLAGGPARVADTVIATLIEREQVRLDGVGRLHRTPLQPADALGKVVAGLIKPRSTTVETIRRKLADEPAVGQLAAELTTARLLADPRPVRRAWGYAAAAYVPIFVLGVVRLVAGSSTGHPVGFLILLLILVVTAGSVSVVFAVDRKPARATTAGKRALATAREDRKLVDGPVGAVALGGLASHPEKDVRLAVSRATPTQVSARSRRSNWAALGGGVGGFSNCGGGGSGGGGGCGG